MKKKSVVTKFLSRRILLLIQLIISIVFLGYIYYLKMLPMKYYLILVGIIALLWFFMSFFIKYGIKKKKKENKYGMLIFSKLLSLVLSISLIIVSVMAFKGNSFLSNITGSLTQTRVISLYVKKESKYKKLSDIQKDLKKMKVGIASEKGTKNINTAIAEIEDATGEEFKIKDYKDYSALGDAIDAGKIDVAVVDNSYSALLEANHEGMDDGLRNLYQVEIEEQVQSVTQKTDVTEKPFIVCGLLFHFFQILIQRIRRQKAAAQNRQAGRGAVMGKDKIRLHSVCLQSIHSVHHFQFGRHFGTPPADFLDPRTAVCSAENFDLII